MLIQLFILLGYSLLCIGAASIGGNGTIGVHWAVLIAHAVGLFIFGLVRFFRGDAQRDAWQYIVASILVATIGHGLCFFNGLVNFNAH